MLQLAEFFPGYPSRLWHLAKQMGVNYAVGPLPKEDHGMKPWDYMNLVQMKQRFADFGLNLQVIESAPETNRIKLGLPGRDEEIDIMCQFITNMGAAGISVLCYNFMAQFNWFRTSTTIRTRGGALVSGYDHALLANAPLTEAGIVSEDQLWEHLKYYLERIVPVAEKAKVRLALHPDDPPISPIRGVSRILRSSDALQQAIDLVPSEYSGITLCQGTLATAGEDIPTVIRKFAAQDKIFFVHFRDVRGTPEKFEETFHDDGKTDMLEAMKTYYEVGFQGPARPDHVPTMEGENNDNPGYELLGRLYGVGYIRGLMEAAAAGERERQIQLAELKV
ncbi:mannonate dehydratase [Paenibacillus sp. FSL H7-0331]|uniref:mannonate dehydratase n=1 Tax=Paenibacillus sp. FSL H7-0331 TaxID=1920421 RepID=UPI00096DF251|nr:mannonate dehydratase [Paenibacillus sp. FSL H7-0331]OMF14887.1 mannonate dehydratase [Paenibacillus sp. FSL H7-0331]